MEAGPSIVRRRAEPMRINVRSDKAVFPHRRFKFAIPLNNFRRIQTDDAFESVGMRGAHGGYFFKRFFKMNVRPDGRARRRHEQAFVNFSDNFTIYRNICFFYTLDNCFQRFGLLSKTLVDHPRDSVYVFYLFDAVDEIESREAGENRWDKRVVDAVAVTTEKVETSADRLELK